VSQGPLAILALAYLALYPIVTSAVWIAGGLLYRLLDERIEADPPPGGWPGVTVLLPAYNEERVIAACLQAAREVEYPELEVLVLDDGSTDDTVAVAEAAAAGDPRVEVVKDPVNVGKAGRLNLGIERARHDLIVVADADTHLHPLAIRLLVARQSRSRRIAAVAGAPRVTNRQNLLCAMQIIEVASIIGLIRRTQALAGRVGVVAGVIGLFRRDAVRAVGGYRAEMATEDIDLTWRLLLAGWHTAYEPSAIAGMEVPSKLGPLWQQRRRWARGLGEVLHEHFREVWRWRNRRLWPLAIESIASLAWVLLLALFYLLFLILGLSGVLSVPSVDGPAMLFAWGVAICVVALVQLSFALRLDFPYDRRAAVAVILGPIYPIAYWVLTAAASLWAELPAWLRGPAERRVVWDVERERLPRG
jgi:poly-beta-1,6-N-acetyl-D-glucosamine synthase